MINRYDLEGINSIMRQTRVTQSKLKLVCSGSISTRQAQSQSPGCVAAHGSALSYIHPPPQKKSHCRCLWKCWLFQSMWSHNVGLKMSFVWTENVLSDKVELCSRWENLWLKCTESRFQAVRAHCERKAGLWLYLASKCTGDTNTQWENIIWVC